MYSSIVLSKKTATALEVVDSYCSYGTVTITLRNIGTKTLPATQQTCIQIDGECSGKCVPLDLEPGKTAVLKISGCTLGKFHRWRIGGPTSSITVGAYC